MTLDLETLAILQKAAMHGQTLADTGLDLTDEVKATFKRLKEEYANAPAGSTAFIVGDLEWGKYDALIAATEKAHGPMFGDETLAEMTSERLAELREAGDNPGTRVSE